MVVLHVSAGPSTVPLVFRTDSVIGAPAAALARSPAALMLRGAGRTPSPRGIVLTAPSRPLTVVWVGVTIPLTTGVRMPVTTDGGRLTPEQALTSAACAGVASSRPSSPIAPARTGVARNGCADGRYLVIMSSSPGLWFLARSGTKCRKLEK